MQSKKNKASRQRRRQAPIDNVVGGATEQSVIGAVKALVPQNRIVRRVLVGTNTISTNGSGYTTVVTSIGQSNTVNSTPLWANYSSSALEYRVEAVEVDWFPIVTDITSFTNPPSCVYACGTWSSGLAPSTVAAVLQSPNGKAVSGIRPFKTVASAKGNSDAQLWTPTSSSIPAADSFGVALSDMGTVPAGPATQAVLRAIAKFIVAFRSLD